MTATIATGFLVPYLVYHAFSEETIESVADYHGEQDEATAELAIDMEPWEI